MEQEKTLTIDSIEKAESQNGRIYHKIKTDEGQMSCFEEDVLKELKKAYANEEKVKVLVVTNEKGFKNIRNYMGVGTTKATTPTDWENKPKISPNPSFYVSYAKDIFCCMLERGKDNPDISLKETMAEAIDLVKQAQNSF